MAEDAYYHGDRLRSMKDINGKNPELFLCTTNRSAGKTTDFAKFLVNNFINYGRKFMLLYRYKYELDDIAGSFFKGVQELFFSDYEMTSIIKKKGVYHELFLNHTHCGYAVALNCAEQVKKLSHLFADTWAMFMDEFQSENNNYCSGEIKKFISIHTSVARGGGKQVRYVPVYMCANAVTLLNPYYVALGICDRLKADTKFLRGDGFVLEHGFNEAASMAQSTSAFNRAFASSQYVAYASQNVYLNDNKTFIEKAQGKNTYLATLRFQGNNYALKQYSDTGIIYCDNVADTTYPLKISVTTDDMSINYVMLKTYDFFLKNMRWYFDRGAFRFKNLQAKQAVLAALSY